MTLVGFVSLATIQIKATPTELDIAPLQYFQQKYIESRLIGNCNRKVCKGIKSPGTLTAACDLKFYC